MENEAEATDTLTFISVIMSFILFFVCIAMR